MSLGIHYITHSREPTKEYMMFYTFCQNNSGGSFDINDSVAEYVVIEATSASQANQIAEEIGIYFNGCDDGIDCQCCGDRWYIVRETDGCEYPEIYDKDPDAVPDHYECGQVYCYVYYLDGEKKAFTA